MRWAAHKISVSHSNLPTLSKFKVLGVGGGQKNFMEICNANYFNYFFTLIYVLCIFYCILIFYYDNKNLMLNFCKHTRRKVTLKWTLKIGWEVGLHC